MCSLDSLEVQKLIESQYAIALSINLVVVLQSILGQCVCSVAYNISVIPLAFHPSVYCGFAGVIASQNVCMMYDENLM